MGTYADPVNEDDNRPATAAEADAQNRIGRENRQRVGLSGYGGRSEYELAEIDYREQQRQEVVQTRREKEQASERNQQASGDSGIDYAVSSRENVRNRPGYTDPDTLGDSRTRMIARLLGFDSENIPEAAQGVILEEQRQKAYDTPTLKDDFFYGTQLEKWKQNKVELSSEYHHETLASGLQQKANPYEYTGDLALEALKGSPRKGSEYTSPSSGSMRDVLPNGRGLQEVMWDSAVARDRGVPQSKQVSFMDSVRVINAAEGLYGSYGSLYGGKVDNRSAFDVLGAQKNAEAPMVYTEANAQAPFLAVGVTHQEILVPSEFDLMAMQANIPIVSGAAVATSDFLFGGRSKVIIDTGRPVYGPVEISYGTPTRTIRELEDGSTVITTNTPVFSTRSVFTPVTTRSEVIPSGFDYGQSKFAEQVTQRVSPELKLPRTGTTMDYNIALVEGGYNELRNKPLTAAMNVGVGMLFVAGGEAVAGLGAGTVAATQGMRFIGPVAKGANFLVNRVAPPVLAGMYVTDVAGRSTQWGTDFSTESTKRLGGIMTTETIPMLAGGVAFANRGAIVSGAKDVYGRVMENPPTFRGVREGISDKIFEFRQGRAGIERLSPDSGTTFSFDVRDTFVTGTSRPVPTQPRLPSGGSTGGADVVFTPTPPKATVSFTDLGGMARDDLIVTKATYAYRSKTPLYDMLTPKENVGVTEGVMRVTQKPENIIPEPRTTTISAVDLTQPVFSREAPLWRKMTLENTKWVPESKEAGMNYIRERYPEQAEIWSDYLTETQKLDITTESWGFERKPMRAPEESIPKPSLKYKEAEQFSAARNIVNNANLNPESSVFPAIYEKSIPVSKMQELHEMATFGINQPSQSGRTQPMVARMPSPETRGITLPYWEVSTQLEEEAISERSFGKIAPFRNPVVSMEPQQKRDTMLAPRPVLVPDVIDKTRIVPSIKIVPDQKIMTDILTTPAPEIKVTPDTETQFRPDIPPPKPPFPTETIILPMLPGLPASGSSGGGYSPEPRIVTWTFSNPVGAELLIADRGKKLKPMKGMGIKKFKPMPKF